MGVSFSGSGRRLTAVLVAGGLVFAAVGTGIGAGVAAGVVAATPAHADTAPPDPATPATVSADALPTVQINGVVWSQVTVGTTVYVTGSFTSARPAGAPLGTNETPRANLLAYNITTGNLITGFNHVLNSQGLFVTASPDGSRIYVGGDFTKVDGQPHDHLAAFSTADGSLISSFRAGTNSTVDALAVTDSTVYAGGIFTAALGSNRLRLAAFAASTGTLLNWAPTADDHKVAAMVLTPDHSRVIVGGKFTTINGQPAYGLGALDPVTGTLLPWAVTATVRDGGVNAGISSLRTDGHQIYGTGFVFGAGGNLEGGFAADPDTGKINWIEDCHGDSYDTFPDGPVLYLVSHEHYCGNIGSFPQTDPWTYHRATAFTTAATGTITKNPISGYANYAGRPDPTQLYWYPILTVGTFTGQTQAAWSVTGAGGYISIGGEFPKVNGVAQQGLVRFAVRSLAPDKMGPRYSATLTPTVVSQSSGTARVSWTSTYDVDNQALTYKVVRDGRTASPVYTTTVDSTAWNLPTVGFTDTGLTPGSTHSYRVYVTDPTGNSTAGSSGSATVSSVALSRYAQGVKADGATDWWRFGEPSGTTAYDWIGVHDLALGPDVAHGQPGPVVGDPATATRFSGSTTATAGTTVAQPATPTLTEEAWISTTSTLGGQIMGFGSASSGASGTTDRQLYLDSTGHLRFGIRVGATLRTIVSPLTYNDGRWYDIVATVSSAGMTLYVDGRAVASAAAAPPVVGGTGYWRVAGDDLTAWPSAPSSFHLAATFADVAVYPTALTPAVIARHYSVARSPATPARRLVRQARRR